MVTDLQTRNLLEYYSLSDGSTNSDIGIVWKSRFNLISLLALRDFFQPETMIVCDRVFLRSPGSTYETEEEFIRKRSILDYDSVKIDEFVASFNWVELQYELGPLNAIADFSDEKLEECEEHIANIVCDSWSLWLNHKYKDRRFIVRAIAPEETGDGWGVGFEELSIADQDH